MWGVLGGEGVSVLMLLSVVGLFLSTHASVESQRAEAFT